MLPQATVGLVYNEPCPLKCDFCCHTPEVVGPGRFTVLNAVPILVKYGALPEVKRFAFTGGDPFVYIRDILEIVSSARLAGVSQPFHIVTSGFWASDEAKAKSWLKQLHALGMDMLYVSFDDEHSKWVNPQSVYFIESLCDELGITLSVYGVFWTPGRRVRDLLPDLRTPHTQESLVAPIGRALQQAHRIVRDTPEATKYSCGKPNDYDITIYPNGDTYPCCSGGFNKKAQLILGNSHTEEAVTILERCFSSFYVRVAKEIGFNKLKERLKAKGADACLPEFFEVATVCEMCVAGRQNRAMKDAIQNVVEEMEVEYCISLFRELRREQIMEANQGAGVDR